jgi:LPS sulfotransferase NodH
LLGKELGLQVINLGVGGVGPAFFNRPPFLKYLNSAEIVVVQVLSGRSEGNRFFDNSEGNGLLGISWLDGKRVRFEKFLEDIVKKWASEPVRAVIQETRQRYLANATSLLDNIHRPKVLLWLSQRSPEYADDYSTASGILGGFPQLINRDMLEALRKHADEFVDCTSSAGIPQELWPAVEAIDGTYLSDGKLFNRYYPSPEIHREVAEHLAPVCRRLMNPPMPSDAPVANATGVASPAERFVILGAERSGTTLVRELLGSHPAVGVGGELFNYDLIRRNEIPWWSGSVRDLDDLNALRASDPKAFVDRLFEMFKTPDRRTFGFKLMYRQVERDSRVRDFLVADRGYRIIHVKRRNLLRRLLSEQRALKTERWFVKASEPRPDNPSVILSVDACIDDFSLTERMRTLYESYFKDHQMLELYYEDICADLPGTRSRLLAFLGLAEMGSVAIWSQKSAVDPLREAIENYDDLKAALPDRAEFFDD